MNNPLDNIAPQDFAQVGEAGAVADTDLLPILHNGQARKVSVGTLLAGAGGFPAELTFTADDPSWGERTSPTDEAKAYSIVVGDTDAAFAYVNIDPDAAGGLPAFDVYAQNADGSVSAEIAFSSGVGDLQISVNGATLQLFGLPTADPLKAKQLYTNGDPTADTPKALMMSGGTT